MPRVTKSTTRARRRKESQAKRNSVLAAAEATFLGYGYQRATTDRIASEAGVSVGTVYNLYGSKKKAYAAVIKRVGREMVAYMERSVLPLHDPDAAIELLVRFRVANFERHRLLLVLFSSERASGAYPDIEEISREAKNLYYRYLDLLTRVFGKGMNHGVFERMHPLHLALSFEGVLDAFVGYWMRPNREGHVEMHPRHIMDAFMKVGGLKRVRPSAALNEEEPQERVVFVTSLDMCRLKELMAVARTFGGEEQAAHLNELENGLRNSKVVNPSAVPSDVVTMNSKVRLKALYSGETELHSLVFPADAGKEPENLSVLEPLGTALLGCWVGAVIEVTAAGRQVQYEVVELLYQPEAFGDYHR